MRGLCRLISPNLFRSHANSEGVGKTLAGLGVWHAPRTQFGCNDACGEIKCVGMRWAASSKNPRTKLPPGRRHGESPTKNTLRNYRGARGFLFPALLRWWGRPPTILASVVGFWNTATRVPSPVVLSDARHALCRAAKRYPRKPRAAEVFVAHGRDPGHFG